MKKWSALGGLAFAAILGSVFAFPAYAKEKTFPEGIYAGDFALGGLTKEQAEEILRKMEQEGYRQASALRDGVQAKQLGAATTVIRCIIPQYPIEGRRSDGKM